MSFYLDTSTDCTSNAALLSSVHTLVYGYGKNLSLSSSLGLLVLQLVLDSWVSLLLLPLWSEAFVTSNLKGIEACVEVRSTY